MEEEIAASLMALMIFAGVAVLWMAMQSRRRFREMEHRERLAMIERGLIPAPERDPAAFERVVAASRPAPSAATLRFRSAGVVTIGLGFGLMFLIGFAGDSPEIAVGIGGAFAVLGASFLLNSFLSRAQGPFPYTSSTVNLPHPPQPRDPPPNPGP